MANSKTLLFSDVFPHDLVKLANPGDVPGMCFLHTLAQSWGILSKNFKMVYAAFPYLFPV